MNYQDDRYNQDYQDDQDDQDYQDYQEDPDDQDDHPNYLITIEQPSSQCN